MEAVYSWIVGLCYLLPFGFGGMSLSLLKPGYNRGILLTILMVCASCTSLTQGAVNSMVVFTLMRMTHALLHSAINPLIFDTVTDYFPSDQRGRANAALMAANFIGISMCSLSIYIVSCLGWRNTFLLMGSVGLTIASFIPFIIK